MPSNSITSITSDKNYVVWVGTTDKGLVRMGNGKCKVYNVFNSEIASNSVATLSKNESGNVVVQCEGVQMLPTHIE